MTHVCDARDGFDAFNNDRLECEREAHERTRTMLELEKGAAVAALKRAHADMERDRDNAEGRCDDLIREKEQAEREREALRSCWEQVCEALKEAERERADAYAIAQNRADRAVVLGGEFGRAEQRIADLEQELATWRSVFPDVAPDRVLPDRALLEQRIADITGELGAFPYGKREAGRDIAGTGADHQNAEAEPRVPAYTIERAEFARERTLREQAHEKCEVFRLERDEALTKLAHAEADAEQAIAYQEQRIADLTALLRYVETRGQWLGCYCCGATGTEEHARNCRLAAALKATPPTTPPADLPATDDPGFRRYDVE